MASSDRQPDEAPEPRDDHDGEPKARRRPRWARGPWLTIVALLGLAVTCYAATTTFDKLNREVSYRDLLAMVDKEEVRDVEIGADRVRATLVAPPAGRQIYATRPPGLDAGPLVQALEAHKIDYRGHVERSAWWSSLLVWLLPLLLIGGAWWWLLRGGRAAAASSRIGASKVRLYDRSQTQPVTFADVAGVDEAEAAMAEVVDFLKQPGKYQRLGARVPKGVLLLGPPGTGKTLLARAVAGEANVPFFSLSGSEFIEMFVGVGAARVRDLFEQAKSRAPCIVFIDEIDAIGRRRSVGLGAAGNDERDQTLGQLLAEMDGFDPSTAVVIMAATNQPEALDPALTRAGRFDRRVLVDRPDVRGRKAILAVHARKLKLAAGVDLELVARRTPGMVGADLAALLNEAALEAARRGADAVEPADLERAVDTVQLGAERRGRTMTQDEQRRVAYHEAGHALVALSVQHADPVHRVSIIPRSIGALGVTLQLPTEEHYLITREELRDRLAVMMGGRAAEEVVCGDISTGAGDDLERATELARQMVTRFGMSDRLGAQTFGRVYAPRYLDVRGLEERNFGEETMRTIDREVQAVLVEQLERARAIVRERRAELEALAARLLVDETLDRERIEALVPARRTTARAA
ncbi:MAG TPA: ATP-dependent zinc metalloprotease FtsH [Kofleriaceae bacterium]|nr:ATP-dependent zinc metalloprotease FtsH [Kofleriaceae bacterium]